MGQEFTIFGCYNVTDVTCHELHTCFQEQARGFYANIALLFHIHSYYTCPLTRQVN